MATLAGRHIPSPRLPWNPEKSVAGSCAFILLGGAGGSLLCWWCRTTVIPPAYPWFSIWMPWLAALTAAAVESIPIRLDDNLSVTAAAAAVLWCTSLVGEDLVSAAMSNALRLLPLAVAVNVAVAAAGYLAKTVTIPGAICGLVIGITIVVTCGWGGWGLLLATFALAVVCSRLGFQRKTLLGIAEGKGGRRALETRWRTREWRAAALLSTLTTRGRLAPCVRHRTRRRGQRHRRQRDRQHGENHVLVPTLARVPRHVRGDIGRRNRRGLWARLRSPRSAPQRAHTSVRGRRGCSRRNDRLVCRERDGRDARSARHREQRRPELCEHRYRRRGSGPSRPDVSMSGQSKPSLFLEFSRPFTLVAPALGFASGAATAAGAAPRESWSIDLVLYPLLGLLMAAVLNAASNALNQIYDLRSIASTSRNARSPRAGSRSATPGPSRVPATSSRSCSRGSSSPGDDTSASGSWPLPQSSPSCTRRRRSERSGWASGPTSRLRSRVACC